MWSSQRRSRSGAINIFALLLTRIDRCDFDDLVNSEDGLLSLLDFVLWQVEIKVEENSE